MQEPYKYKVKIDKQYNDTYGDHHVCICGNDYRAHFTTWYEPSDTYNGCTNFILKSHDVAHPDEARQRGARDAIMGLPIDEEYCSVNIFIDKSYRKGYDKKSGLSIDWEDLETLDETDIDWWNSNGIELGDDNDGYEITFSDDE